MVHCRRLMGQMWLRSHRLYTPALRWPLPLKGSREDTVVVGYMFFFIFMDVVMEAEMKMVGSKVEEGWERVRHGQMIHSSDPWREQPQKKMHFFYSRRPRLRLNVSFCLVVNRHVRFYQLNLLQWLIDDVFNTQQCHDFFRLWRNKISSKEGSMLTLRDRRLNFSST